MKLPKTYFTNLSQNKYREYLKLLPDMHKENTRLITFLIFTFAAITFFGVFAINPTLTTIFELQKQLSDNQEVQQKLTQKINNLSSLQQQYSGMTGELPVLFEAIPENPQAPIFTGQIEAIAQETNIQLLGFRVSEVQVSTQTPQKTEEVASFTFTAEAQGTYESLLSFVDSLTNMRRLVTIERASMIKTQRSDELILTILGRSYFKESK